CTGSTAICPASKTCPSPEQPMMCSPGCAPLPTPAPSCSCSTHSAKTSPPTETRWSGWPPTSCPTGDQTPRLRMRRLYAYMRMAWAEAGMGRANVYLPDDLERRVKAAQIPISEICQRALLAAVEAAETGGGRLQRALRQHFRRGRAAGEAWARAAAPE